MKKYIDDMLKNVLGYSFGMDSLGKKAHSASSSIVSAIFEFGEASGIKSERSRIAVYLRTLRLNARTNVKSLADMIERGDHDRPNP